MIKQSKGINTRHNPSVTAGITLIALVITIVILLILAGISISILTDSGLFQKTKEAKEKSEVAQELENETLKEYESKVNEYLSDKVNGSSGKNDEETLEIITFEEAQSDDMLTKTVNSQTEDVKENKITIPAGFKIKVDKDTNNATTVDKGIVIVDSEENEFVWIPVGTIKKTDGSTVTINLDRYTFDENGVATAQGNAVINDYHQELATSTYENITAKNIEGFKASVIKNGGYYIGRYEARTGTKRTSKNDTITAVTEKGTDYVYNYVTQPQAAELARNMYKDATTFTSDLMNSYAWDTAIIFLQSYGTNKTYSTQISLNTTLAKTGTNNIETKDLQCNVYDIGSNIYEWTTETSSQSIYNVVARGGGFYLREANVASCRARDTINLSCDFYGFRPILYL